MDLKVVFVVVFLSALAITSTHGGIPRCCIITKPLTKQILLKAERWEQQYSNGACDIDALVLYVKNRTKPHCLEPRMEKILTRFRKEKRSRHQKSRV